eukprot:979077-Rhodomonas_salina.1
MRERERGREGESKLKHCKSVTLMCERHRSQLEGLIGDILLRHGQKTPSAREAPQATNQP